MPNAARAHECGDICAGFLGAIGAGGAFAAAFQPAGAPPLVGVIPEPGTLVLLASGLLAFAGVARQRMK